MFGEMNHQENTLCIEKKDEILSIVVLCSLIMRQEILSITFLGIKNYL